MKRFTLKEIRKDDRTDEFNRRLKDYEIANNTSGLPTAFALGLRKIGYAEGYIGCIGTIYEDIETKEIIGVPHRGSNIYIE